MRLYSPSHFSLCFIWLSLSILWFLWPFGSLRVDSMISCWGSRCMWMERGDGLWGGGLSFSRELDLGSHPADANIVTWKWVFTIKYHLDGTTARHKARMVARGFTQAYGIDYTETFSPIVHLNSVRMLLSLAINQAWSLHKLDVSSFLLVFLDNLYTCSYYVSSKSLHSHSW